MRFMAILVAVLAATTSFLAVLLIRTVGSDAPAASAAASTQVGPAAPAQHQAQASAGATAKKVGLGIISYNLGAFEKQTKIFPLITAKYYDWGTPFPSADIIANHSVGATTLVVLEPRTQNMKKLAAGKYDSYLKQWAAADKKTGLPIILSFAPEANGDWYPWGKGHVSAALFRKLYQHVHNVLIKDGAKRITWLWQVDRSSANTESLKAIFPGSAYVNEIGFDGQLSIATSTFDRVFGPTLKQVRAFTKLPVLLSEVGVEQGSTAAAKIKNLYAAAHKNSLTALVFFDVGVWNFDKNKAAVSALRAEAAPKN